MIAELRWSWYMHEHLHTKQNYAMYKLIRTLTSDKLY